MSKTRLDYLNAANPRSTKLVCKEGKIEILNIPIPPSSNAQYKIVNRGGKSHLAPTEELKAFKNFFEAIPYVNLKDHLELSKKSEKWKEEKQVYAVHAFFYFHRSTLFTKSSGPRMMDVSNRIKSLHDALVGLIGIDDSFFWDVHAHKRLHQNRDQPHEYVDVLIHPIGNY